MPALLSVIAPLALRSPALVKTAARDPITAPLVARSIAAVDPQLARCVEVVSFPGADSACMEAFLGADCVLATGSDATIAAVAARIGPGQTLVRHGHRLSIALLGPDACDGAALDEAARGIALDVALWDQQGCLSPVAIYALGAERVPDALLAALAGAFAEAASRWPRGRALPDATARLGVERDTAELRAAAGADVRVAAGQGFVLVAEPDIAFRGSPLQRFVRVHPAPSRERLLEAMAKLGPHLAAVGVAGLGPRSGPLERELAELGATRICPLGSLQAPPLDWCHDQLGVLLPLVRLADIEG
jgi:hypothetical protein